jgi:hypothetical protein
MSERDRLEEMAEAAAADWLRRSSISFLECAIHLMLTHMSKEEVVEALRTEASMVEELD